eukprot:4377622-Amphidinium_carterae.1
MAPITVQRVATGLRGRARVGPGTWRWGGQSCKPLARQRLRGVSNDCTMTLERPAERGWQGQLVK